MGIMGISVLNMVIEACMYDFYLPQSRFQLPVNYPNVGLSLYV